MNALQNYAIPILIGAASLKVMFGTPRIAPPQLDPPSRKHLEERVKEYAAKLGIHKEVELCETEKGPFFVRGNNFLPGKIRVYVNPLAINHHGLEQTSFIVAHELGHAKNNDLLTIPLVHFLVTLLVTVLARKYLMQSVRLNSRANSLGGILGIVAFSVFSTWRERHADLTALSIVEPNIRKAGAEFMDEVRRLNLEQKAENPRLSFLTSDTGEQHIDIAHPSLESRAQVIREYSSNSNK